MAYNGPDRRQHLDDPREEGRKDENGFIDRMEAEGRSPTTLAVRKTDDPAHLRVAAAEHVARTLRS